MLELHCLLDFIMKNSSFIAFFILFIETLSVHVIQQSLESSLILLSDTSDIQLERNFNSSIFKQSREQLTHSSEHLFQKAFLQTVLLIIKMMQILQCSSVSNSLRTQHSVKFSAAKEIQRVLSI